MKNVRTDAPQMPTKSELLLKFPNGILGFDQAKEFSLHPAAPGSPYLWLELTSQPGHGFVVVAPDSCAPGYAPDISQPDVEFLGLQSPDDAFVLNIVTLRPNGEATANLRAPLVLNRHTLVGKQCVPANVSTFSIQHPIHPLAAAAA
jgi:flagellar assembly factor FliW